MKGINFGEKNGKWKGNNVTYGALHNWVRKQIKKPKLCGMCNKRKKLQLSCKNHNYKKDLSLWRYICQSCHSKLDKKRKIYYCKICKKVISYTSGKFGKSRCGSCAKKIDQRKRRKK